MSKKMIYTLTEIREQYKADRQVYESLHILKQSGYTINEHYDLDNAGINTDNQRAKTFLEKILDNLEYFGHLVKDKIDNYILGRLYNLAQQFSVDKIINYLKQQHCYC